MRRAGLSSLSLWPAIQPYLVCTVLLLDIFHLPTREISTPVRRGIYILFGHFYLLLGHLHIFNHHHHLP